MSYTRSPQPLGHEQATPGRSQSLLKLMFIQSVMPSNHLIFCHPLLLPSILPSIRVFSNESVLCIRWPKYWSFSFSISPSSEYSGLSSFRIDWCDLLAVQGTLKSLFQHHSSKASILWHSAFLMAQFSHPYMTTGKSIALTRQTFVGKVMSLLFWYAVRFVIAFLPRSKSLLISWLQSLSAMILEPKNIKSLTVPIVSPSISPSIRSWPCDRDLKGRQSNMVLSKHGMSSKGSCYNLRYLVTLGSKIVSDWNIPTIDMLGYLSGQNLGPGEVILLLYGYYVCLYIDILQQL